MARHVRLAAGVVAIALVIFLPFNTYWALGGDEDDVDRRFAWQPLARAGRAGALRWPPLPRRAL